MTSLKNEQETNLVALIIENYGITLNKITFTESALQLFEDIAGFEVLDDFELQRSLTKLWRIYNDQRNEN